MSHKSRSEQINARKDPRKLARPTKRHTPKNAYKRVRNVNKDFDYDNTAT